MKLNVLLTLTLAVSTMSPVANAWYDEDRFTYYSSTSAWVDRFPGTEESYQKLCDGSLKAEATIDNMPILLETLSASKYVLNLDGSICAGNEAQALARLFAVLGELIQAPSPDMGKDRIESITKKRANTWISGRHFAVMTYINLLNKYQSRYPQVVESASGILYYIARYDSQTKIRRMAMIGYTAFRNDDSKIRRLLNNVASLDGALIFDGKYNRYGDDTHLRADFVKGYEDGEPLMTGSANTEYLDDMRISVRGDRIEIEPSFYVSSPTYQRAERVELQGPADEVVAELENIRRGLLKQLSDLKVIYSNPGSEESKRLAEAVIRKVDSEIQRNLSDLSYRELEVYLPYSAGQSPMQTIKGRALCGVSDILKYSHRREARTIEGHCGSLKRNLQLRATIEQAIKQEQAGAELREILLAGIEEAEAELSTPVTEANLTGYDRAFWYVDRLLANNVTLILSENTRKFAREILDGYSTFKGNLCAILEAAEDGGLKDDIDLTMDHERDNSADIMYSLQLERGQCGKP